MIDTIRTFLAKLINDIDCGNSDISEQEMLEIIELMKAYSRKDVPMSKYQSYTYLNVSRATFDNLVKNNKIPKGIKIAGYKEKSWFKRDLDEYIKNNKRSI